MKLKMWHIFGLIFILITGFFLHYAYKWSNESSIVSYFAPVSESVWEHLKLIFWPFFFFSLAEFGVYGKRETDFFGVKMCGIFSAILWTVVSFYTYSGVLGFNLLMCDIVIFISSCILCQWVSYMLMTRKSLKDAADNFRSFIVLLLFAICFFVWTKNPPYLGIFWG